jgi:hypothetical protein
MDGQNVNPPPIGSANGLKGIAVNAPVAVFTDHALTV